jgi:hypothetical protein
MITQPYFQLTELADKLAWLGNSCLGFQANVTFNCAASAWLGNSRQASKHCDGKASLSHATAKHKAKQQPGAAANNNNNNNNHSNNKNKRDSSILFFSSLRWATCTPASWCQPYSKVHDSCETYYGCNNNIPIDNTSKLFLISELQISLFHFLEMQSGRHGSIGYGSFSMCCLSCSFALFSLLFVAKEQSSKQNKQTPNKKQRKRNDEEQTAKRKLKIKTTMMLTLGIGNNFQSSKPNTRV